MHQLYMHYLACRGEWRESTLVVKVKKECRRTEEELHEWWTYDHMVEVHGAELARDLKDRHLHSEKLLPKEKKGLFVRKPLACISRLR